MPAKRLPWIKFYPELLEHEKFADLTDSESWTWINVWAKASQQPVRWRFASAAHAAKVTGRPAKQINRLISARLLDDASDGLWVHDWQQWQNRYPSDYEGSDDGTTSSPEHPPNGAAKAPRTLPEGSANAAATLPQAPSRAAERAKIEIEIEKRDIDEDEDVDEEPPAPAERPPTQIGKPTKIRRPISNDTIERLVAEYGPQFGAEGVVRDWITRALNHTARLKALDEALYVERTWLKPELGKLKARENQMATADELEAMSSAPTVPKRWQTCSACGRRGNFVISDEPLCGGCGDKRQQRGAA